MREVKVRTKEDEIVKLIKDRGFTSVAQFAESIGMNPANVWRNIKGYSGIDTEIIFRYAMALHVSVEDLLSLFMPDAMHKLRCSVTKYNNKHTDEVGEEEDGER